VIVEEFERRHHEDDDDDDDQGEHGKEVRINVHGEKGGKWNVKVK
jgi:hypothetical protein